MSTFTNEIQSFVQNSVLKDRANFKNLAKQAGIDIEAPFAGYSESLSTLLDEHNHYIDALFFKEYQDVLNNANSAFKQDFITHLKSYSTFADQVFIKKQFTNINQIAIQGKHLGLLFDRHNIDIKSEHLANFEQKSLELEELKGKLQELIDEYADAEEKLKDGISKAEQLIVLFESNKQVASELEALKKSANQAIDEIAKQKELAVNKLNEVDRFLTEVFVPLKTKVEDSTTGLNAILTKANTISEGIKNKDAEVSAHLADVVAKRNEVDLKIQELNTHISDATNRVNQIQKDSERLENLLSKAFDGEHGFEKKVSLIKEAKAEVDAMVGSIKVSHDRASKHDEEIKNFKNNAKKAVEEIASSKSTAELDEKKINEILKIVSNNAQTKDFSNARDKYNNEKFLYFVIIIVTSLIAALFSYDLFKNNINGISNLGPADIIPTLILKASYLTPFIFIIAFVARQYRRASLSYEKYVFKTVMSYTWRSHVKELMDSFTHNEELDEAHLNEIFQLAISSLKKIYDEPYYDENMKKEWQLEELRAKFGQTNQESQQ